MHLNSATIFQLRHQVETSSKVLDLIGVYSDNVFKKCPKKCLLCASKNFCQLELAGVWNKPLFWECEECGSLYCKMEKQMIEALIDISVAGTWTCYNDWVKPDRDQFS